MIAWGYAYELALKLLCDRRSLRQIRVDCQPRLAITTVLGHDYNYRVLESAQVMGGGRRICALILGTIVLLTLPKLIAVAFQSTTPKDSKSVVAAMETSKTVPISILPNPVDFGGIAQGSAAQREFWMQNRTSRAITINRFETSCECLTIELDRQQVLAGERVRAVAKLDLATEPLFSGSLQITAVGRFDGTTSNDEKALEITVVAEVMKTK